MRDIKNAPPQVMRVPYPVQVPREQMAAPPSTKQLEVTEEVEDELEENDED